ncbi:tyrosine-type recombinase/integrase [Clostridium sp.]|uniref:tyrosine-type recombinase/integrase n=1 Tax=Clostridium sp. TaxID=1506 RepID=UPI003FD8BCD0
MNLVEPIKDKEIVRSIIDYLKNDNERDSILFLIGIYTGLRIGDILKLQVKDVAGKKSLNIRDTKTKKSNRLEFNQELKKALDHYTNNKSSEEFLIISKKGNNKPITRGQAYKILKKVANLYNIDNIGTHSMRKTFGYHLYNQTKDIVQVQKALNHSDASYTRRYIGIDSEIINKSIKKLRY